MRTVSPLEVVAYCYWKTARRVRADRADATDAAMLTAMVRRADLPDRLHFGAVDALGLLREREQAWAEARR